MWQPVKCGLVFLLQEERIQEEEPPQAAADEEPEYDVPPDIPPHVPEVRELPEPEVRPSVLQPLVDSHLSAAAFSQNLLEILTVERPKATCLRFQDEPEYEEPPELPARSDDLLDAEAPPLPYRSNAVEEEEEDDDGEYEELAEPAPPPTPPGLCERPLLWS